MVGSGDLTLPTHRGSIGASEPGVKPIDREWLRRVTDRARQTEAAEVATTPKGRPAGPSASGDAERDRLLVGLGEHLILITPIPFPWANHLFQDSASLAMGAFEGHMAKMADGFRTIRLANRVAGDADPAEGDSDLSHFELADFSDEEWELCPPVVAVGGDGAMYDIGFQNLSRAMMSGKPIKVVVLDTQVYSNTGGQACTAGFFSQVSDMAPYGKANPGKQEVRKEIGLIGYGPPHDLRDAEHDRTSQSYDRRVHSRPQARRRRFVQPLRSLPTRTRDRRRG
jgi:pyruvate-ferredoxin/flavodoxin oxidoreductase